MCLLLESLLFVTILLYMIVKKDGEKIAILIYKINY